MYIGNTYGAGTGTDCLDEVYCPRTATSFFDCRFIIADHDDPSLDVSICCFAGMILQYQ